MDNKLWKYIFDQQPKMNERIVEGIAVRQLEGPELRIDRVWRIASKLFPEGLTYEGFTPCTPEEELAQKTRRRNGQTLELSQSDVFMVKFKFNYRGRDLVEVPLYLPFCREAGSIFIRGSRFTISPVIADRCLSVSKGSVFFPPLRDKITFTQFPWPVIIDDRQETVYVQKSKIHHHTQDVETKKLAGSIQGHHTLVHYLFCRYGLLDTFRLHFDCDAVFGDEQSINTTTHPKEDWVVVRSVGALPRRGAHRNEHYVPSPLRVAIPRQQWNGAVESAVAGFFYIADLFSERVTLEDIGNERLWGILFGILIFGGASGEGKVLDDFRNHLASLDQYIDEVTREDLHDDGVLVDNIYELFAFIIEQMPRLLANTDVANLEGKQLITWKYVLHDIIRAIFQLTYLLNPKGRKLQEQDLKKTFVRNLSPELIMKINGAGHPEVTNISSPSDSMITKFTTSALPQSRAGTRNTRGDHDRTFSDPSTHFHPSIMAAGSFLNQPKSDPGGASKLNPYAQLGNRDEFQIPERFRAQLDDVKKKLAR